MTIRPGEFWVADIPYTDGSGSKKRPVLVLWLDANDVVVAAVTSAGPRTVTDVSLRKWQVAGLRVASTVRLSRLDCLEQALLVGRIGKIEAQDAGLVKQTWVAHVVPQF
ncbi:MAG: type II toxin-antitoxin system PemK/MazF family toxin [Pirellulales bacterium]